jgi:hypothetical protein
VAAVVLAVGLAVSAAPALADVTVAGDLNINAGASPEAWTGSVDVQPGASPRTIAGDFWVQSALYANGAACAFGAQCGSGFCVEGVCCNAVCSGGACQSCRLAGVVGTCTIVPAGTVCRAAAGACDTAETCDGTAAACPGDTLKAAGTVCRAAAGPCDVAETCSGGSAACPVDTFVAAGTICRAAAGSCDVAEACTGTAAACPGDGFVAAGTVCRASTGACDPAETCSGSVAACPADALSAAGTVCRAAAGPCDTAETCTGAATACPGDTLKAAGTVCRAAAGPCDVAETCSGGAAACPADTFVAAGTVCRAAAGSCDVTEACTGSAAACPADGFIAAGTVCRASAGACDPAETCSGSAATCPADTLSAAGTVCRAAAGPCDTAETCSGGSTACPSDTLKAAGTVCRAAAGPCDTAETCSGSAAACPTDAFKSNATVCRASSGPCDVAEKCSGSAATCPADAALQTPPNCSGQRAVTFSMQPTPFAVSFIKDFPFALSTGDPNNFARTQANDWALSAAASAYGDSIFYPRDQAHAGAYGCYQWSVSAGPSCKPELQLYTAGILCDGCSQDKSPIYNPTGITRRHIRPNFSTPNNGTAYAGYYLIPGWNEFAGYRFSNGVTNTYSYHMEIGDPIGFPIKTGCYGEYCGGQNIFSTRAGPNFRRVNHGEITPDYFGMVPQDPASLADPKKWLYMALQSNQLFGPNGTPPWGRGDAWIVDDLVSTTVVGGVSGINGVADDSVNPPQFGGGVGPHPACPSGHTCGPISGAPRAYYDYYPPTGDVVVYITGMGTSGNSLADAADYFAVHDLLLGTRTSLSPTLAAITTFLGNLWHNNREEIIPPTNMTTMIYGHSLGSLDAAWLQQAGYADSIEAIGVPNVLAPAAMQARPGNTNGLIDFYMGLNDTFTYQGTPLSGYCTATYNCTVVNTGATVFTAHSRTNYFGTGVTSRSY